MTLIEHYQLRHKEFEKPEEVEPEFLLGWHTFYYRKCKTIKSDALQTSEKRDTINKS